MIINFLLSISLSAYADTIIINDFPPRCFQRDIGQKTGSVAVSGSYTGNPSFIQARVVLDGTSSEVLSWTSLENASIEQGTFSGILKGVPQGDGYNIQIRFGNNTKIVSNGTARWGMGILVGIIGQSNGTDWFTLAYGGGGTLKASPSLYYYNGSWSHPKNQNDGAIAFANMLINKLGVPVGCLTYAVGLSGLISNFYNTGYWLDPSPEGLYKAYTTAVVECGGIVEFNIFIQGETEGLNGVSRDTYYNGLKTLYNNLKVDCGKETTLLLSSLGSYYYSPKSYIENNNWQNIIDAQRTASENIPGIYLAAYTKDVTLYDYPMSKSIHRKGKDLAIEGQRHAQTVLFILGKETYYRGPSLLGYNRLNETHIDVFIVHRAGTDFTPGTGINGFTVIDEGTIVPVSSAIRKDCRTISLTLKHPVSTKLIISYAYGFFPFPDHQGSIHDNTPIALPLEDGFANIQMTPEIRDYYYNAETLIDKGKFIEAADQFINIKKINHDALINPRFINVLYNKVALFTNRNDYDEALNYLLKIKDLQPANADNYYNIACLYSKQNRKDESVNWLRQAIEKGFNNWDLITKDPDLENVRTTSYVIKITKGQ
jgi:tetratricopeptide (TPR) repeat protein